jgi:hypothetical protein
MKKRAACEKRPHSRRKDLMKLKVVVQLPHCVELKGEEERNGKQEEEEKEEKKRTAATDDDAAHDEPHQEKSSRTKETE